jgi:hypothetical protein
MNPIDQIAAKLPLSKDTLARNPHLITSGIITSGQIANVTAVEGIRVRQSTKPVMNKLETEWFHILNIQHLMFPRPRPQAVTFKLCNGMRYTPDVFTTAWPQGDQYGIRATAWEVKGPKAFDGSLDKLKMAAHEWPEILWILVWKESGRWTQQIILQ